MYENCSTTVRCEAEDCVGSSVQVGLHQGSALSPYLFTLLLGILTEDLRREMLYADDGFLCATDDEELNFKAEGWRNCLEERGLRINRIKTVGMRCEFEEAERERKVDLEIDFHKLEEVESFKYLGFVIQNTGDLDEELTGRMQSGWSSWRKCARDRRIMVKLKSKIQHQVVRPAMLYSSETLATKKRYENRIDVTKMRMLRWQCGLTRKDKVRNEQVRGTLKIAPASNKVRTYKETRGRPPDKEDDGHGTTRWRGLGRPKLRWIDCVKRDMRELGLNEEDALDRKRWKNVLKNHYSDPK
ncbi:uncharacterized protein LOC135196535 [Macrobrachium nipponense]|uniref:uncharacterized protein LOC135196535 n=1 Tax=Macrobrachium nipponense TaxID=159736 RepID=UPI0030C7CA36